MTFRFARSLVVALILLGIAGGASGINVAAPYVNADYMWARGYTGSGAEIGVIDLYLADGNHPAIDGNYLGYVKFTWVRTPRPSLAPRQARTPRTRAWLRRRAGGRARR